MKTETSSIKDKESEIDLENINKSEYVERNSDNISKSEKENSNNKNNNEEVKNRSPKIKSPVKYHIPMKNKMQKPFGKSASNELSNPKSGSFQFTDNNLRNANGEISGIKLDIINDNSNNLNFINYKDSNNNLNNQIDISEINKNNNNELIDDCEDHPYSDQKLNNWKNNNNLDGNDEEEKENENNNNNNNHKTLNNKNIHFKNHNNIKNIAEVDNFAISEKERTTKKKVEFVNDNENEKEIGNENKKNKKAEEDNISVFEYIELPPGGTIKEEIKKYCTNMKKLGPNKVYVFSLATVCVFNFISFAIQYWVSDHFKQVMHFDETAITVSFIVTCVTAPVSGVIIGGFIVGKLGGYARKEAVLFCLVAALFAALDSILIVFQNTLIGCSVVLWFFLFFGGATIPNMLGK